MTTTTIALRYTALWLVAVAVCAGPAGAADGLLGHWKFDGASGSLAEDASGEANDADVWGVQWVKGAFGTALRFTGSDSYVSVPEIADLDGSKELTVEAWVMWEAGGRYPNILTGGRWSPGGFLLFVRDETCSFRMGRPGHAASDPGGGWTETSAPLLGKIELGRWYHIAATFKQPDITSYVDGVEVGSANWDYPVGYEGDLLIGRWGGTAECHEGLIDEVRIHNRALSADEVLASYAAETQRRAPGQAYEVIPDADRGGPAIATVQTELITLEIDERARCVSLVDRKTGRDLIEKPVPIASVRAGGKTLRRTRCTYIGGKLEIEFGKSEVKAVLGLVPKADYIVFEVESVEGQEVEELTFLTLQPTPAKYRSPTSGLIGDDECGVCVRALNLQTRVGIGGSPPTVRATAEDDYGLVGARAALVAGPSERLRSALQEMVRNEGVPQSSLGGPWALEAEANRGSYLFARVSEDTVDAWIDLAKRGGFTHIHFSTWGKSLGHYEPNPTLFPNGLEGMKAAVKRIHDAGLKAGMHTLTGCIATNDSWVTPVPDARLAADANYTLAADIAPDAKAIPTLQPPGGHDTIWSYSGSGNVVRIGTELIHYAAISREEPYGFLDCTRGAFGSTVAAHAEGAAVDHLRQRYLAFYPDEKTDLVDEVADAIARVYNECEMDQIYMDGAEGMGSWHAVAVMRDAIYSRLNRPALVEASSWGHWSWYYHSRIGAWDHPKWGLKQFVDMHCGDIPRYRKGALIQAQLGWWVILGPSGFNRAEMPDEIEYFCGKILANDAPMSIQGIGALQRPANARMPEYLTTIGQYERLRLAGYFSEEVKEKLREPGDEFRLRQADDGEWVFVPTDYLEHKVTAPDGPTGSWAVTNRFDRQPVRMRIEALHSAHPYDSRDALTITDYADQDEFKVHADASGVSHTVERSDEQAQPGLPSLRITATNTRDTRRGAWTKAGRRFQPHFNMGQCDAVGLWVHGDGKGEILNVQFSNPPEYSHSYAEHYITIDFEGWRYFALLLRERDAAAYRDYEWPYYSQHGIFRNRLIRDHVSELNLYLNNLPPDDTASVALSPIKALRTSEVELTNPTVELNGQELTIPVTLRSGSYVELESAADCRVYDARCDLLERVEIEGDLPVLDQGENRVSFTCEGPAGLPARADVTVVASGPELRGRAPNGEVDRAMLGKEYEAPRTVTQLDGRQNQWDLVCRRGAGNARLEMELQVEKTGATGESYEDPAALTVESFDDVSFFADSPGNEFAKYVYDSENSGISAKPGVTQEMTQSTDIVKAGASSARYTATSTRTDSGGWSARGRRFAEPLDLSGFAGLGAWLHGDGQGESLKLQLRDQAGAWHDMVTTVDFVGWRYVEFDISGANLDLHKIEYLIIYYNGIPAGRTVTCHIDDVRALPAAPPVKRPELTVAGKRIVFPVELSAGDRLVFKGPKDCWVQSGPKGQREAVRPEGKPAMLSPGPNQVTLGFGAGSPQQFRMTVSLAKAYR